MKRKIILLVVIVLLGLTLGGVVSHLTVEHQMKIKELNYVIRAVTIDKNKNLTSQEIQIITKQYYEGRKIYGEILVKQYKSDLKSGIIFGGIAGIIIAFITYMLDENRKGKYKAVAIILGFIIIIVFNVQNIEGNLMNITSMEGAKTNKKSQNEEVVVIKNPNLEKVVRGLINKESGDIYVSDVEKITKLEANKMGITTIDGLQYFKNLEDLRLNTNRIDSIEALSGLTKLKNLSLAENSGIKDISALTNLQNLTYLNLTNNYYIEDLKPIMNLSSLREVYLFRIRNVDNDVKQLKEKNKNIKIYY